MADTLNSEGGGGGSLSFALSLFSPIMGLEGWDLFAEVLLKESRMAGSQIGNNRTTLKYLIHMKDTHSLPKPSTGSIDSFGYCCVLVQKC